MSIVSVRKGVNVVVQTVTVKIGECYPAFVEETVPAIVKILIMRRELNYEYNEDA